MFHIIVIIIAIISCYIWGDWRNWSKYEKTILFFILGDFTYNFLAYNKPLWSYDGSILNHTLIDILMAIFIFPCTLMIYLPRFPQKLLGKVLHILKWVTTYSAVEYTSHLFGHFSYDNGWNEWASILFNCFMFPLLYIHYKKSYLGYILAAIGGSIIVFIFNINLQDMR